MNQIHGIGRDQIEFSCLEDTIGKDSPVRVMDAFVYKLDLSKLGFQSRPYQTEGRPSFENTVFMKIYLYGYINGIRSSRKVESDCLRNIISS
jgi:transposase